MALDRLAKLAIDIIVNGGRAKTQLAGVRNSIKKNTTAIRNLRRVMSGIALGAAVFFTLRRAIRAATNVVKLSIRNFAELEQQITNIAKIAKTKDINKLGKSFFDITKAIRGVNFKDVSGTMISAARAGVTLDTGLVGLSKAALRLQSASLDITARDAAEGLAALSINLTGSVEGVENLASGIDALSDNFITTSGEILKTSARLSGFAAAVGLSVEDLNALSAALLSTKISPTIVRSSVGRIFGAIAFETEKTAQALQFTSGEFRNFAALLKSSPLDAVKLFIRSLNKLPLNEQKAALKKLGLASFRTESAIRILSGSLKQLNKAQKISNDETKTGTSLLVKELRTFDSTANKIKDIENAWKAFTASLVNSKPILNTIIGLLELISPETSGLDISFDTDKLKTLDQIRAKTEGLINLNQKAAEDQLAINEKLEGRGRFGGTVELLSSVGSLVGLRESSLKLLVKQAQILGEVQQRTKKINALNELAQKIKGPQKRDFDKALSTGEKSRENRLKKINDLQEKGNKLSNELKKIKLDIHLEDMKARPQLFDLNKREKEAAKKLHEIVKQLINERGLQERLEKSLLKIQKEKIDAKEEELKKAKALTEEQKNQKKEQITLDKLVDKRLRLELKGVLIDLGTDKFAQSMQKLDEEAQELAEQFRFLNDVDKQRLETALSLKRIEEKAKARKKADDKQSDTLGGFIGDLSGPLQTAFKFAEGFKELPFSLGMSLDKIFEKDFLKKDFGEIKKPEFMGLTDVWKKAITDTEDKNKISKEQLELAKRMVDLTVEGKILNEQIKAKLDEIAGNTAKKLEVGP